MSRIVKLTLAAAAFAGLLSVSPVQAQALAPNYLGSNSYRYNPYGYGFDYFSPYAGGTAAGNYLRGASQVIQAEGQYLHDRAQAYSIYEAARAQYLENQSSYVRTYFEKQKLNKDYRDATREPKATHEQLVRWAKEGVPGRADRSELDQSSGIILWPAALMASEFDYLRAAMEKLYGERTATNYGPTSLVYGDVQRVAAAMRETLKEQVHGMDVTEYLTARKMIDRLAYEARFAPAVPNVASK